MKRICAFLVVFVFLFGGILQAGTVGLDCSVPDSDRVRSFVGCDGGSGNDAAAPVEIMRSIGSGQVNASYEIDADLIFHITKTVNNETAYAWTSHGLALDGNDSATFVDIGDTNSNIFSSYTLVPSIIKGISENLFWRTSEFFPFRLMPDKSRFIYE